MEVTLRNVRGYNIWGRYIFFFFLKKRLLTKFAFFRILDLFCILFGEILYTHARNSWNFHFSFKRSGRSVTIEYLDNLTRYGSSIGFVQRYFRSFLNNRLANREGSKVVCGWYRDPSEIPGVQVIFLSFEPSRYDRETCSRLFFVERPTVCLTISNTDESPYYTWPYISYKTCFKMSIQKYKNSKETIKQISFISWSLSSIISRVNVKITLLIHINVHYF